MPIIEIFLLNQMDFMIQSFKNLLATAMVARGKQRKLPVEALEVRHQNTDVPGFNDSSYFAGISNRGFSFVSRQSFREGRPNENWLKVDVPDEGVWGFENRFMEEGHGFKQGSLEWKCLEPGQTWAIFYIGLIQKDQLEEQVIIDLKWRATSPIVNFDKVGTNPGQVGKQIAREKWTREYFKRLGELQQVHYEQAGQITGTITWRGVEHKVELTGVRDHSYGARQWQDWDRHLWYLGVLEDGRFFNFSLVRYDFVKDLQAGFMVNNTVQQTIYSMPSFDEMQWGSLMPKEVFFPVVEQKGTYKKQLHVNMRSFFPFLMDDVYYIRQAKAEFIFDGIRGIGIAEMGINLNKYDIEISHTC